MWWGEPIYSKRYHSVRVFDSESTACGYVANVFGLPCKAMVVKSESDGMYVYRVRGDGFATGSPLAGFAVRQTEMVRDREVIRGDSSIWSSGGGRR